MHIKKSNYLHLVIWILSLQLVGIALGAITRSGIDPWYHSLNKSLLTPPDYVFPVVWTSLYLLIAISGWILWSTSRHPNIRFIKSSFIAQLIANWVWSSLFFYYHLTAFALLDILILCALNYIIVIRTSHQYKVISLIFIVYAAWTTFAAYLNFYIWLYN